MLDAQKEGTELLEGISAENGAHVAPEHVTAAITVGEFVYDDGATQVFDASGTTTYVEAGRTTQGEWYLDSEGRFCSFWPPSYRACYELHWVVEQGGITGLRFTELNRGTVFTGRYR